MKKLIITLKQISILFLALTFTGCEDDDTVLPKVVANFTYTINIDTGTVTFLNISENANTYEWDFGDGNASTEINPIKVYSNGTYTVILEANNVAGASDTFQDEITISIPEIVTIPISFDGVNTNYGATTFGGASFELVDNPDASGTNTSASKVGAITNSGAAYEGFYFDLGSPIDLTTDKTIKMNFWSNAAVDILLKLEEGTGAAVEVVASHGGTGWETIYFTFDSDSSYSRFTMFVDGPGTTAGTFYMDDVMQISTTDIPCIETNLELPIDFDCNGIAFTDKIVGNVSFNVIDNPELSGINAEESKVGVITNVGANWENAFFNLDTPVDFSVDKGIAFKMFSDQALPIKLKFEDGTEAPVEVDVNHGGTGWEELTFNFTSTASFNDMVIFVDGPGTASGTFYIDDIEQVAGDAGTPCEAEAMQSLAGADFNLTFMSDPTSSIIEDGGDFTWIDNPDFDNDINKSCKVGQITKLGNNPWDNNQIDLDAKLDFNANEGLKIKVWSARANTEVRIKLEEIGTPSNNVEQFLTTTVTNAWEELTFPFTSADSGKFDKIVIFFDLNANNTDTYYFDDLMLYGTGGGTGGTFDDGLLTNGDFENGAEAWIGNALDVQTEGDNSFNFANVTTVGNAFDVNLSQVVEIIEGKNYTLNFDASSDGNRTMLAGIGLNQDPWTNDTQSVNLTSETQSYTLELSSAAFGGANSRVIFDMGADLGVVVIDNVSLFCNDCDGGGGTGGSCPAPPAGDFITDGDFEANADCWELFDNGGSTTISTSISNGGSNSGQIITATGANPGLKQTRFGAGTIQPNTTYEVTFDIIASSALVDGAVFQAFTFSEPEDGSGLPATQHVLIAGDPSVTATWVTRTYEFTTAANVDGGLSLLFELVCGGAGTCGGTINIDNVSLKVK
ncbi:PKD domain-containing protein [Flaviramulus sp. BrNp1-15]|uniref:carbohydrate binding domain-containing protein n=1 Tax=Flaviramulus sp. BrNp1-15 TaxID=2916754 RepID=UPI001EE85CF3|nr:carbohydrate binding domain-containing protein [Flaviramulus sp. BrNp1-15]ULC58447.1 PKD domain-containing protein [Flaviramulus sp. BrNp1-15]